MIDSPHAARSAVLKHPDVTPEQWAEAHADIQAGRSVLLAHRPEDGRQRHIVRMAGVARQVVYAPLGGHILDILQGNHACPPSRRPKKRRARWDSD